MPEGQTAKKRKIKRFILSGELIAELDDDRGGVRQKIREFVREERTRRITFRRRKPADAGTAA